MVWIGLKQGITSAAEVGDLVDAISGIVITDVRSPDLPSVWVQVPPKTEQSALITALARSAHPGVDLDILGPGVP